jgi:hypothetical protein
MVSPGGAREPVVTYWHRSEVRATAGTLTA